MANKKYDHVDIEYVVDQYTNHKRTSVELAAELGMSDWWIRDRLSKENILIRKQGGGLTTIDLTGQIFGSHTVLEKVERPGITQSARWLVKCECGNVHEVYGKALRLRQANSCGICNGVSNKWKGVGELSETYFQTLIRNANSRSLKFELDKDYLWSLFLEQDRKCKLSGLSISLKRTYSGENRIKQTASLDRKDSNMGYYEGNVQWVHKDINQMKWSHTEEYFLEMCKIITENNN